MDVPRLLRDSVSPTGIQLFPGTEISGYKSSTHLIFIPCLCILHASEGRIRESKGTKGGREKAVRALRSLCKVLPLKPFQKLDSGCFNANAAFAITISIKHNQHQGYFYLIKLVFCNCDCFQYQTEFAFPSQVNHL